MRHAVFTGFQRLVFLRCFKSCSSPVSVKCLFERWPEIPSCQDLEEINWCSSCEMVENTANQLEIEGKKFPLSHLWGSKMRRVTGNFSTNCLQ